MKKLINKIKIWLIHKLGGECTQQIKMTPLIVEKKIYPTIKYRAMEKISSYDKSLYGEKYMKEKLALDLARNIINEMEVFVDDNYETDITTYEAEIEIVKKGTRI